MGLYPSPHTCKALVEKKWNPLIKGAAISSFCSKGFYNVYFENNLDRDLVFRGGPISWELRGSTWIIGAPTSILKVMFLH